MWTPPKSYMNLVWEQLLYSIMLTLVLPVVIRLFSLTSDKETSLHTVKCLANPVRQRCEKSLVFFRRVRQPLWCWCYGKKCILFIVWVALVIGSIFGHSNFSKTCWFLLNGPAHARMGRRYKMMRWSRSIACKKRSTDCYNRCWRSGYLFTYFGCRPVAPPHPLHRTDLSWEKVRLSETPFLYWLKQSQFIV